MKFGIHLPNSGGAAVSPDLLVNYASIKKIAKESERLNYDSIWANEHVTLPSEELPSGTKFFEPITTLSALSGLTTKIVLGTAIVILPFRDPFILAKEVATLADLSNGRIVVGVGPGRFEREYSAQDKSWKGRNQKLDEQVRLVRELLSGNPVTFEGQHYRSHNFSISPVPEKLPIILGGSGPNAIRRAAKLYDGIMPGHVTPGGAGEIWKSSQEELRSNGRARSDFKFYCEIILSIEESMEKAQAKFDASTYVRKIPYASNLNSKALIGTPKSVTKKIEEYQNSGVDEFILIMADETLPSFESSMKLFAETVLPTFN